MKNRTDTAEGPNDARRLELLDTSIGVFVRYGFRKTSMDEVARAAGISRQGLYLYFPSKEALFRDVVALVLERTLGAGRAALDDEARGIEERLLSSLDAMHGQYVEALGGTSHLAELLAASAEHVGELIEEQERTFRGAVAKALKQSGVADAWAGAGLSARDLAETLLTVSHGAKHGAPTRPTYVERVRRAVRLICRGGAGRSG